MNRGRLVVVDPSKDGRLVVDRFVLDPSRPVGRQASKTMPDEAGLLLLIVSKANATTKSATRWAAQPLKKHSTSLVPPGDAESGRNCSERLVQLN